MSDRTERYLYRCSRDSLMTHLKHVEESGDTVEWPIYMGEQGFWLICRRADDVDQETGPRRLYDSANDGARRGTEAGLSERDRRARMRDAADLMGPGLTS